mgnify:CR=1 FL=1
MIPRSPEERPGLLAAYAAALREEPKLRFYVLGALIDDIGVACSIWVFQLIMVNLFTDQGQRARFLVPNMIVLLVGSLLGGPLADWARSSLAQLARWRWRLLVWARLVEAPALGLAIWSFAGGEPTLRRVLPYFLISSLLKSMLRATRSAFEVDLLHRQEVQRDEKGAVLLDECGQPRVYKLHLLTCAGMLSFMRAAAMLVGLVIGGKLLRAVGGSYVPILIFDALTSLGFAMFVALGCHPDRSARNVRWRDLGPESEAHSLLAERARAGGRSLLGEAGRELAASLREVVRFLRRREQRPLLYLLVGQWMLAIINEFYDGRMMVKHVLHGSDDSVRHAEILWSIAETAVLACIPALARRVSRLGKLFLITLFLDGAAMALAGRIGGLGVMTAIAPFIATLAADRVLWQAGNALADLAQNSATSSALRGRLISVFDFVVLCTSLLAQGLATVLADRYGISGTLLRAGAAQLLLIAVIAVAGGRALWSFGLRSAPGTADAMGGTARKK